MEARTISVIKNVEPNFDRVYVLSSVLLTSEEAWEQIVDEGIEEELEEGEQDNSVAASYGFPYGYIYYIVSN